MIQFVVLVLTVATMTGCASTKAYFVDRGRDTADIFTCSAGIGLGAKVRVGPLGPGLFANQDKFGLRGGEMLGVHENSGEAQEFVFPAVLEGWPVFGLEQFEVSEQMETRHKAYRAGSFFPPFVFFPEEGTSGYTSCSYFTQIEVAVGLGGSLRLGLNLGELLDFILGWTTIDIFNDDLEARKKEAEANQPAHAAGKPAPGR